MQCLDACCPRITVSRRRHAGEVLSKRQAGVGHEAPTSSRSAAEAPAADGAVASGPPPAAQADPVSAAVPAESHGGVASGAPRDAEVDARASSASGGTSQAAPATPDAAAAEEPLSGKKRARRESSNPSPQPEPDEVGGRCACFPPTPPPRLPSNAVCERCECSTRAEWGRLATPPEVSALPVSNLCTLISEEAVEFVRVTDLWQKKRWHGCD